MVPNYERGEMEMSPAVTKLVGQAVVQYLNGNRDLFNNWVQRAQEEYHVQKLKDRLHASIREILEAKGVVL